MDIVKTASAIMMMAEHNESPTEENLKRYMGEVEMPRPRITEIKRLAIGFDWRIVYEMLLTERKRGGEEDAE